MSRARLLAVPCSRSLSDALCHLGRHVWDVHDHFRLVTLPDVDVLTTAVERLGNFLGSYSQ